MIRGVYLVLDPDQTEGRPAASIADEALRAGVAAVQWRQKGGSWTARWADLLQVRALCAAAGVPFLVNDRVDVALAAGADGAHIGQDDLPPHVARDLLGDRLLGLSVTDPVQAHDAVHSGADYLGAGPIFATPSKADAAPAIGLDGLRAVRGATDLPIVAIGGITAANAAGAFEAGADAVAVISAVCRAPDIAAAVRALRDAFEVRA